MDPWSFLVVAATIWWGLSLLVHVGSAAAALREFAVRRKQATNSDQPPISILIPVKDVAPEIEESFATAFAQDYPRFEIVISAADHGATALAVARCVAADFPRVPARFIVEAVRVAVSPKTDNLVVPLARAAHDLILIKDANPHLAAGQLARLMRYMTPGIGLVCAIPIVVEAQNLVAEIEATMLNGRGARFLLAASWLGKGIGMGGAMLFDRRAFDRAGGIPAIAYAIGEDHAISKALARIGLRTVFAAETVLHHAGRRRLSDVWTRQLRWMVIRRLDEPLAFAAELGSGLVFTIFAGVLALAGIASWWLVGAVTLAIWLAAEAAFVRISGWEWTWRTLIATICREIMLVGLVVRAASARRIFWGGRTIVVRRRPARS